MDAPLTMLTTAELAARRDFRLGDVLVSPSRRMVTGPGGTVVVEPRVMQLLVVLADQPGNVVSREALFNRCWGSVHVGNDSLNRAVGGVRKLATGIAGGSFEIETIPRVGYRLNGAVSEIAAEPADPAAPVESDGKGATTERTLSRRMVIGGSAAAAVSAGLAGLLWLSKDRTDPRFTTLMERGEEALRLDDAAAARYFEQAVQLEPRNPKALGLLAYALASGADSGPRAVPGQTAQVAMRAARTALEIEPNEPNALLVLTMLQSDMLDWLSREERHRQVLAVDPNNTRAMRSLGQMLHSVGRCRDSLAMAERALAIEPLTPDLQLRKALRLWVLGDVAQADRVIDRAMELWPSHHLVRMARLMIYAFTDRPRAALALVEREETRPILLSPTAASVWRTSLRALETPTASTIAAARDATVDGSKATPAIAAYGILLLSALGELDTAFDVAYGFLLGRGSVIVQPRPEAAVPRVNHPGWRNTFGLFTPPTKAMRLDPRFQALADGLGLTEYWSKRGIGPDSFLFKA